MDTVDILAVWESVFTTDHIRESLQEPAGICEARQDCIDYLAPCVDRWYYFSVEHLGFDGAYDLEFCDTFIPAMPTGQCARWTGDDIKSALAAVLDGPLDPALFQTPYMDLGALPTAVPSGYYLEAQVTALVPAEDEYHYRTAQRGELPHIFHLWVRVLHTDTGDYHPNYPDPVIELDELNQWQADACLTLLESRNVDCEQVGPRAFTP